MKESKVSLGLDFGTESLRVLAVDVNTGDEAAIVSYTYPHGVMTEHIPGTAIRLGQDWALQDPADWIEGITTALRQIFREYQISPEEIIGIGVSFTSCTVLPTKEDGTPLCFIPELRREPHAWPKLWKHHSAQKEADLINEKAAQENEIWLKRYAGCISSEWVFPKALQILRESPKCYEAASKFIEAGDWIVWMLTGEEKRSACQAGYKALWNEKEGYPQKEFLEKVYPSFGNIVKKLGSTIYPIGECAGGVTFEMAEKSGLLPGTPVGVAIIDAHAAVPGSAVVEPEKMVLVMGTSTCHMVLSEKEIFAEGIAGVVKDGIIPDYFGYESGQAAVGDIFAWVIKYGLPESYYAESKDNGISLHELLSQKAALQKAGEHGLIALDWMNGNRSVLMNSNLSGLIVGITLHTKPEDIYRAMIEATAFGTRKIIERHEEHGIVIKEFYATGGLSKTSPLAMQIYADVTGRPIHVAKSSQATALGAAVIGAVASGSKRGGYDSFIEASNSITRKSDQRFLPNENDSKIYEKLYKKYLDLHDYFGEKKPQFMKDLRKMTGDTH